MSRYILTCCNQSLSASMPRLMTGPYQRAIGTDYNTVLNLIDAINLTIGKFRRLVNRLMGLLPYEVTFLLFFWVRLFWPLLL